MRTQFLLSALLLLGACADEYADAEKANTIESWSTYLDKNPDSMQAIVAKGKLEGLLIEKAKASNLVADWDAYLARFPDGKSVSVAKDAREALLLEEAVTAGTADAYKKFLDTVPDASTPRRSVAEAGLAATSYPLEVGELRIEQVNLAEDPKGPLDGWGFRADIKNAGDKTVEVLIYRLELQDAAGKVLASKEWPLVGPDKVWSSPVPESWMVPVQPGETRTYDYTTGSMPEGWGNKARLVPLKIVFGAEAAPATP